MPNSTKRKAYCTTDLGYIYWRLYSDPGGYHYSGFMRQRPDEPAQYLMAADPKWSTYPRKYAVRLRIHTPPDNLRRIEVRV